MIGTCLLGTKIAGKLGSSEIIRNREFQAKSLLACDVMKASVLSYSLVQNHSSNCADNLITYHMYR